MTDFKVLYPQDLETEPLIREGLQVFIDWYNLLPETKEVPEDQISYNMYWDYDDAPVLLSDVQFANDRVITLRCDPIHDEGGPQVLILYVFFGILDEVIQIFDTRSTIIYSERKFKLP